MLFSSGTAATAHQGGNLPQFFLLMQFLTNRKEGAKRVN
jgi:hypothetical protein